MTTYGSSVPVAPQEDEGHVHATRRAILWIIRALTYLVYAYVIFVEIILLLGFFLLLAGANPSSSFVEWVYRSLDRVMEPFRGMFTPIELGTTSGNEVESIFETSVLFAMIIYVIVAILINVLLDWLTGRIRRLDWEDAQYHQQIARERTAQSQAEAAAAAAVAAVNAPTTAAPVAPPAAAPVVEPPPSGPGPATGSPPPAD